jgi:structure-specific endonuclease subunit SLX1
MTTISFVYLLVSTKGSTYVGATVDLNRRLRQHNKEIKGGAKATTLKVEKGEKWERVAHISEFPNWQAALQFEWRWKQLTKKIKLKITPIERRFLALKELIKLDASTRKAIPFNEWINPPKIHLETETAIKIYGHEISLEESMVKLNP